MNDAAPSQMAQDGANGGQLAQGVAKVKQMRGLLGGYLDTLKVEAGNGDPLGAVVPVRGNAHDPLAALDHQPCRGVDTL